MTITNSIILLNTDPLFELSVSYTSSHPTILSNTGQVITPEVDTLVTLTYVIKQGLTTILTGSIQLDILSTPALTPYYQSAQGLTGGALLAELTKIISRNYNGISYSATNKVLEIADKHPSGNGYLGIYDHVSITSYNKEHVWPQSSFSKASPYKSDMHHLRISNVSTNETRSNYYFNNPTSPTSDWQVGSSRFFPGDLDKGDIARMLMYMAVRYRNDNFRLIIAESGRTSEGKSRTMGNLAVLYDWHISDPVDAFEENRNDVIFGTQNNRNPFIDHPELFHDVWSYFMAENEAPQSLSIDDNGYLNTFQTPSFTNLSTQLG
jgi:endonuclease I